MSLRTHIGLGGIQNLDQMAQVKAVLPETVFKHGYAILNAEDDRVYAMRKGLNCNIALFSMDENNKRIKKHCANGGIAAVFETGYVTIMKGTWKIRIEKVNNIPITYGGKATHNIMNTLPSIIACYLFKNIKVEDIRTALHTFIPSETQTPGRLNLFQFRNFKFLIDFAHNPAGLNLLCDFVNRLGSNYKVGIISGTGDRRDDDIREIGRISAKNFDEIIIRQDKNLRGRTADEIVNLLVEGINESKTSDLPVTILHKEKEAILHAYKNVKPGAIITIMCDVIPDALDFIKQLKEEEDKST
ncbi:MAG: cyanophycin synthetase [Chitinophagaceae bacterium]